MQVVARCGIGGEGAPLAISAFLDFLAHGRTAHLLLLVVHLHHVDARQVLLHLLTILYAFAVDHVVYVLNLVVTHRCQVWLRSCGDPKDSLVNGRELSVFVSPSRHKTLLARITTLLLLILADTADFRQLELRLAVVTFEPTLHVVEWLELWSASHGGLVTSTDRGAHPNYFILARVYLILLSCLADPLATIEKLNGLLRVLVVGVLRAFFSTDTTNNTCIARTPAVVNASFANVPLR